MQLALAAAEELGVPLPIASLLRNRFLTLLAHGGDKLDWSTIVRLRRETPATQAEGLEDGQKREYAAMSCSAREARALPMRTPIALAVPTRPLLHL